MTMDTSLTRPDRDYWTAALLWESCRRRTRVDAVEDALRQGADPHAALSAAMSHRVAALLWRTLASAGQTSALGDEEERLRAIADVHRYQAVLLLPEAVRRAVTPLTDAGLEPVVLKGPALAARYPEPGLRQMEDIDLLLPPADHTRAVRALESRGWSVARPSARDRYDAVLCHPGVPSLALELHYGLEAPYERVTRLDAVELWNHRVPIDCLGTPAFGLPLEQEIVMLAAHSGKPYHGFSRLIWIADLGMVIGYADDHGVRVDWESVRDVAGRGRCATVVGTALALADRVGVDAPPDLLHVPTSGWRAAALVPVLDATWPVAQSEISTFHLRFAMVDSLWRRSVLVVGSGHGMPLARRIWFSLVAPVQALRRLKKLRRRPVSAGRRAALPS